MPACLLDLTRLMSRLGQGPLTGIDRVEAAWAEQLLARPDPVLGLVRSRLGFLVLDRAGMGALLDHARNGLALPKADWWMQLRRHGSTNRDRAEGLVRQLARHRIARPLLRLTLRRLFPIGGVYLNLGHANLTDPVMRAVAGAGLRRVVMVHDTIPLDHPQYSGSGIPEKFATKLGVVSRGADLVVHLSHATRQTTESHLAALGRVPPGVVAPLAVPAPVTADADHSELRPAGPYFIALGTIEPRKNTVFLLDLWENLPMPRPTLLLLGRKGWEDAGILARAADQDGIGLISGLSDAQIAGLLNDSRGLLFPSLAEGFGLPPIEAAMLGVPVVANPLPVLRETLGSYPIYHAADDINSWMETILTLITGQPHRNQPFIPGSGAGVSACWDDHVNVVFAALGQIGFRDQGYGQE